jgi:hypothetical protein
LLKSETTGSLWDVLALNIPILILVLAGKTPQLPKLPPAIVNDPFEAGIAGPPQLFIGLVVSMALLELK